MADAGLVYVGARWYSPRLRRFISPDPVGVPDAAVTGVNRFHYGLDNPLAYTDPDGEFVQFIVKFAMDVAIESAIQYATSGEVDLKDAATSAAIGMFNPAKTLQRANKLMGITSKAIKSGKVTKAVGNLKGIPLKEAKQSMSKWDKATYDTLSDSIRDHAKRHGFGNDIPKYLRKSANFNKKGAKQKNLEDGATRWNRRNGEFLIERNGKIVTYGVNK
ncbi:hypothetical Protein YC6258_02803 [Gynuella sunshinyii YC6258]|uniref:Rhs family protein n=1 Tax=Gynuella sunshinyii YC6258 TaxID=1445510 RepID=A0A0C5VKM9_9GAMM|nr:hypothetical Protein YC6258_02803 [Gynuella sunshinyii YC6258]